MTFEDTIRLLTGGVKTIIENYNIILIILIQFLGLGSLGYLGFVKKYPKLRSLKIESIFTLGIGLNVIFSFVGVWLSTLWSGTLAFTAKGLFYFSLIGVFLFFFSLIRENKFQISSLSFPFFILAILFLVVRFAFIAGLEYPLYHDSAIHYQIITDFLNPTQPALAVFRIENLVFNRYYHFGYHSFIAVLAVILNGAASTAKIMLAGGQTFLILFPISLGILTRALHDDPKAGWFVAVLAGFGWSFPAYAVNWGKYPALLAMILFPLALYWSIKVRRAQNDTRGVYFLLFLISMFAMALLHSRALLLMVFSLPVFYLIRKADSRLSGEYLPYFLFANIQLISLITLFNPHFRDAFVHYFQGFNFVVTLLALILVFLTLKHNVRATMGVLTFLSLLALAASLHVPDALSKFMGNYFFDQPFSAIALFAPLSIVSGIGLYEFLEELKKHFHVHPRFFEVSLTVLAGGLFLLRPIIDYLPSPCCFYMREDDVFTIGWMTDTLSKESTIFIATQNDFPSKDPLDAGAWIFPLTGLRTEKLSWDTDFTERNVRQKLCLYEPAYIYASVVNPSFSISSLESLPAHFALALGFPETRLYEVNCDD